MASMTETASSQLSRVQSLIATMETSLANVNVQEYWTADGRKVTRAKYEAVLATLYQRETILLRRVAVQTGQRPTFTVGRIGKVGRSSR